MLPSTPLLQPLLLVLLLLLPSAVLPLTLPGKLMSVSLLLNTWLLLLLLAACARAE
jgi:hypothetical protein